MRWIIESSLRFRLLAVAIAAGVMAFGVVQLRDAPVDVLPEFTPPYVEIQTEALGLSADEVEQLITVPLEADLLNGVENVDVIRSESVPGLSSITMVFAPDTDLFRGRALVQERMTQAHALPNVSKPPFMLQPLSSSSRVMMIGLSSKKLSPIEMGLRARWTIRPRLMGVPGVANVAIWGQREQELQVQVDPKELADKNVTLQQVIRSAGNAQLVSPLTFLEASTPGTGGFIETPQQRLGVRHVFDNLSTPEALGKITVEGTQRKLRLTDVSTIKEDHQPLIGDAVVNGGDGIMLVVEKLPGANTVEVTKGVEAALAQLRPAIAGVQVDQNVFRPASFIETAIDNLTLAIIIGALLLALALAAFVFAWRAVLAAIVTIPLSLVAAATVLDLMGQTMNAIAFAGLAAAIAVVVGDSVFGVDNIARRVREAREQGSTRQTAALVLDATMQTRGPLTYAGIVALLAIIPVLVMEGRPGAFFEPLALGYLLAILASMLVALTVTPALSLMLLSRGGPGRESPLLAGLRRRYDTLLAAVMSRPKAVLGGAGACALIALLALPLMGSSVIPSFKDTDVLVRLDAAPGTSQPAMSSLTAKASRELRAIPGVNKVGGHVGRAVTGDRTVDVNNSEVWVTLDSGADHGKTVAAINSVVDRLQGASHDVVTYSQQQIRDTGALRDGEANTGKDSKLDVLTGTDKPLVVRLFGENQQTLTEKAKDVQQLVAGVDGVVNPQIEVVPTEKLIEIETRLDDAARYGIRPGDVRRTEAAILQGITVGSIFGKQKVFDVTVQGAPSTRTSVESIKDILIDSEGGGHVPLGRVADVRLVDAASVIKRDAVARRIDIKADISGRSFSSVRENIEERLAQLPLPLEYHAEVLDDGPQQEIATTSVIGFGIAALVAMFLLIQVALRSWRMAAMVFLTLPVALLGAVAAALVLGSELSLGALLGLLAVFAVAARGSIAVVASIHETERRNAAASPELVRMAATDRLAPIVGAAGATAAVLLPLALLGGRAGLEIVHPMAVVILGGLVTATALSLLVVPALYAQFSTGMPPEPSDDDELIGRWANVEADEQRSATSAPDWESAPSRAPSRASVGATAGSPEGDAGVATAEPADGAPRAD